MARSRSRSKKQRGNIEKLPSGARRVRVYGGTDPVTGKRYDLKEFVAPGPDAGDRSERILARLISQVHEQTHPKTNATVNQLLDRHLDMLQLAESTKRTYRRYIDTHIRPLVGEQKVGRLDAHILESFYAELLRCRAHCRNKRFIEHRTERQHTCDERCRRHACQPLAPWTVRKIHFIISGAFERAVRWRWVSTNPCEQAKPPRAPAPDPQPPTPEEAARLLNEAWRDLDFGTLVWTVMTTGPRRAEVCGLRWRHFDAERQLLTYHRNLVQDGTDLWETDTKTHQRRNIALDSQTVAVLSDYQEHCRERAAALDLEITPDSFIFSPSPDGSTPLKPSSLTQRYNRLAERLGINTTLHKLRHYSATELIAGGVDIRTVAGRLGHSGGGTTTLRVYAAWVSEADQRASKTLLERVPDRPALPDPIERAKTDPQTPYEHIAAEVRGRILAGDYVTGAPAPTVKQLAHTHGVAEATAHRALGLLKTWGLIEATRGRRAVVTGTPDEPTADSQSAPGTSPTAERTGHSATPPTLTLHLLHMGRKLRTFTTRADPHDLDQLHALLTSAVRRYKQGDSARLEEYELEARQPYTDELVTTYVALGDGNTP